MTSDGDYFFIADNSNGVHALRYNGTDFVYFQTVANVDFPRVLAVNENQTYAVVGCNDKIILYSFDGLAFTKIN